MAGMLAAMHDQGMSRMLAVLAKLPGAGSVGRVPVAGRVAGACPGEYPVSACVALAVRRAASKLTMAGGQYSLLLEVEDESIICTVAVDHDIIQSQLGRLLPLVPC